MLVGETTLMKGDFTRMSANLQCSFLHKKQEGSSGKCHLNKLLGKGKALYVATRQKESLLQGKKKVSWHGRF